MRRGHLPTLGLACLLGVLLMPVAARAWDDVAEVHSADSRLGAHVIPASRSLHGPGQPGVAGERAEAAGLGGERIPGGAGGVHDRPVAAREDAVAQPPLAQV